MGALGVVCCAWWLTVGEQFSGRVRVPIKNRTTCARTRAAGKPGARLSCQTVPAGRKEVVGATSCERHDWAAVPGVPFCGSSTPPKTGQLARLLW